MSLAADFFTQNEWASLVLIEACRDLDDGQLDATISGTYGSIRDTFRHIVSSEGSYAADLGHEPSPRLHSGDPWPGFDALAEMVSAAADSLRAATGDETDRTLRVGSTSQYDVEATIVLIQAFHHSTDHRSQICTILTSLGVEPPDWSSWRWGLSVDRMRRV